MDNSTVDDHLEELRSLQAELADWRDEWQEQSEPDPADLPTPIDAGHPVHGSVSDLQDFYEGRRLPFAARTAWARLCTYSRQHGDGSPLEQAYAAQDAADGLLGWVDSEIERLGDPAGPWSQPDSPEQWAKRYRTTRKTLQDWFRAGTVRHKRLSPKAIMIHLNDLPDPTKD